MYNLLLSRIKSYMVRHDQSSLYDYRDFLIIFAYITINVQSDKFDQFILENRITFINVVKL